MDMEDTELPRLVVILDGQPVEIATLSNSDPTKSGKHSLKLSSRSPSKILSSPRFRSVRNFDAQSKLRERSHPTAFVPPFMPAKAAASVILWKPSFFQHGGVGAVAALAATATDDKSVVSLLNSSLPEHDLCDVVKFLDGIEKHNDLRFKTELIDRSKTDKTPSKRIDVSRPRHRVSKARRQVPPSSQPSGQPSPSSQPSGQPSCQPSSQPSHQPSCSGAAMQVRPETDMDISVPGWSDHLIRLGDDLDRFLQPHIYGRPAGFDSTTGGWE
ncbi:hypothetical protein B0T24DRAFT_123300 [Lasiosphaeria ovina]|uniref:Uncharacterized protein n=1 Tax=Lasiosphaeria ovina TaxID=92902 RepID=A0AAE0MXL0_9PEZI|nr:hypothetical protein B0T24DRAFT_123300 [Lasiosphaeria ovina]